MKKILVIHGPNLDLLGKREPEIYGKVTLVKINQELQKIAKAKKVSLKIFQSNHEGEIVDAIGKSKKNLAPYSLTQLPTHTSVAIRDAIAACGVPAVEIHLSNIYSREEFRHISLIAPVACGQISGFGVNSYILGLHAAIALISKT